MSFSNTAETDLLNLIFNKSLPSYLGTLSATGLTDFYLALHTADPGEAGSFAAEATYTGYARVNVVRTAGGWTVSGATAQNTALVQFPQCTGGTNTITHVSVCTAVSAGTLLISGALNSSLAVSNLITPQFSAGAITFTLD